MKKKTIIFSLLASLVVGLSLILLPAVPKLVEAQNAGSELRGWGWSTDVGWISFNSKDTTNPTVSYAVALVDDGSGGKNLSGYAWSSNVGWIKFDPSLTGASGQGDNWGAKIDASNNLTGWARVCSVYVSGCAGPEKSVSGTELSGWDGWIKMNNTTYNPTTGSLLGYAWGALNLGWVNLSNVTTGEVTPNQLAVSCTVSPGTTSTGQDVTWTSTVTGGATPYTYTWSGTGVDSSSDKTKFSGAGPVVVNYPTEGNYSVNLDVTDADQNSATTQCLVAASNPGNPGDPGGPDNPEIVINPGTIKETLCDDGQDNDSDGKVDCDDPDCAEFEKCTQVPTECTFGVADSPGWIELTFGNTEDYRYSPNGASLLVTLDGCNNNINLDYSDLPTNTLMVCKVNSGSWVDCGSINGSKGDDIRIGVKARRSDVNKNELDESGCKQININNVSNPANSIKNEVCFSDIFGN